MKNGILLILLAVSVLACSPKQSVIVGQWEMTHTLLDIGDGSGQFTPAEGMKTVDFLADGTLKCSSSICSMMTEDAPSTGTYSLNDKTIASPACDQELTINFELTENELQIFYPCIEGCIEKYKRKK